MKIKKYLGCDGGYLVFEQEGFSNRDSFGDIVWVGYDDSHECEVILIADWASEDEIHAWLEECDAALGVAISVCDAVMEYQ